MSLQASVYNQTNNLGEHCNIYLRSLQIVKTNKDSKHPLISSNLASKTKRSISGECFLSGGIHLYTNRFNTYLWMEWTEAPPSVLSVSMLLLELRLDDFLEPFLLKPSAGISDTAENVFLCSSSRLLSDAVGMYTDISKEISHCIALLKIR